MRLWQTFCAAVTLGAFLFACEGSKTAKKTSDEDEDEQDTKPATAQSSPAGSAATSAPTAASSSASAVASEESSKDEDAPPGTPADAVLLDDGKRVIALSVKPDGSTNLLAFQSGENGSPLTPIEAEKISGKVRSDEGEWLDLTSGKDGASAKLPKLEPGLTVVQLALEIAGEAFEESIDIPEGGTASLTDDSTVTVPPGTKGPNGGTVEVVGKQRVEVVIDEETDDVRVYFLNEKLEVMEVPEGTDITLAIEHEGGTK